MEARLRERGGQATRPVLARCSTSYVLLRTASQRCKMYITPSPAACRGAAVSLPSAVVRANCVDHNRQHEGANDRYYDQRDAALTLNVVHDSADATR